MKSTIDKRSIRDLFYTPANLIPNNKSKLIQSTKKVGLCQLTQTHHLI